MVPASTLMYGSSFWIDTDTPRLFSSRPNEAAVIPFPSELTTPPVKKMNLAMGDASLRRTSAGAPPGLVAPADYARLTLRCGRYHRDDEAVEVRIVADRVDASARQ